VVQSLKLLYIVRASAVVLAVLAGSGCSGKNILKKIEIGA
jgi:hypothetical protein